MSRLVISLWAPMLYISPSTPLLEHQVRGAVVVVDVDPVAHVAAVALQRHRACRRAGW